MQSCLSRQSGGASRGPGPCSEPLVLPTQAVLKVPMAGPCLVQDVLAMEVKASPSRPPWYERHVQPCLAELLGTALFIFIGCLAVLEDSGGTGRLQPALAHGLALGVTVTVLGNIR